ncbi:MAG: type IV pilin protein [Paraclostridium sp.]|uniref:type IV pilin protein n=1 Tax=Paraclostridium sp. TaxID=2023273 RepID=UPI003F31BD9F
MKKNSKKKNNKGFTLIELLVVIAIIGILAVVAVPALFKNIEKAKIADLESNISAIKSASLSYYSDNGNYPTDMTKISSELESLSEPFSSQYAFTGTAPSPLVLTITPANDKLSQSGYDKLVKDLGASNFATDSSKTSIKINIIKG